jgi:hypothetical protein
MLAGLFPPNGFWPSTRYGGTAPVRLPVRVEYSKSLVFTGLGTAGTGGTAHLPGLRKKRKPTLFPLVRAVRPGTPVRPGTAQNIQNLKSDDYYSWLMTIKNHW